jgi:hypothetical protein
LADRDLSVHAFTEMLRSEVQAIADEHRWSMDDQTKRGWAFQIWVARLLCLEDGGYETEPDDSLLRSKDLLVDVCLDDPTRQHLLLAQCKYVGLSKGNVVDESEVIAFFSRHEALLDRHWVQKHGSNDAVLALEDYGEKLAAGYGARFVFASTAKASERVKSLPAIHDKAYSSKGVPVTCTLYDLHGLKELYVRAHSVEGEVPRQVRIKLGGARFFRKKEPFDTIAAVVSGNELRNLYAVHQEALFNWNIRGYLGSRGINDRIKQTALGDPGSFYYYNNGVSAVCTGLEIQKDNELVAENFQIINGAQTIGALWKAGPKDGVEVLLRVTRTGSVKSEKGFHRDIIEYNNSQNAIKVSDFRSNDPIQRWLEEKFQKLKASGPVPEVHYLRKRKVGKRGWGHCIRLEELAKIRYSFLVEPTLIHASPRMLWTEAEDGGVYDRAFGIDGELVSIWPDDVLNEVRAAIAIYFAIVAAIRVQIEADAAYRYLYRLRFHCLSLAGRQWRAFSPTQREKLLSSSSAFAEQFQLTWEALFDTVADAYEDASETTTMFAFVRSEPTFVKMVKKFDRKSRSRR